MLDVDPLMCEGECLLTKEVISLPIRGRSDSVVVIVIPPVSSQVQASVCGVDQG